MKICLKSLLVPFCLVALASCRPIFLQTLSPSGSPEYTLGWEDGCDSGISAEDSGPFYKWVYGFKKRPEMVGQDQYKQGWNEGFSYCRFSYAASKQSSESFSWWGE